MLDVELLLEAYRMGVFPMAVNKMGEIGWFSPDPRGVIPLDDRFHVPHGLRRTLKKHEFQITFDADFGRVIRACGRLRPEGTWISREIVGAYENLHRIGHAHSVEIWQDKKLVGGLYGVHIGGAFFGESMFHRATDASKVALVALVDHLRRQGFFLLDTQWVTPHLSQFGAFEMPRDDYLAMLAGATSMRCEF
jgi:leucyl/phenylalanyl-tRNA--protein transferase